MRNYLPLGDEEDGLELELTFNGEVLDSQVVLPVIGQALVERPVLFWLDVVGVTGPDGLRLVELFVLNLLLLDLLLLLLVFSLVFVLDFLDLGLVLVFLLLLLLLLLVVVNLLKVPLVYACEYKEERTYSIDLLGHDELDGVRNELGVFLDDLLDLFLLEILELVLLQVHADFSTTTERGVDGVGGDGEGTASRRFPDVLFVVVVLRDDLNALGNEVGRIETDTELTNHGNISTRTERLMKIE